MLVAGAPHLPELRAASPDLILKQGTNVGLRLDETLPEGTKAVQRAPLALLSTLSPARDDCGSAGGRCAAS